MESVDNSDGQKAMSEAAVPLTSAAAMKTHVTLLIGLVLCAAAFWFEVKRALGGNALSWAYVFEWPLLAIFAIYMWWKILHPGFTIRRRLEKPALAPEYEGMLVAWQAEQQKLEAVRSKDERDTSKLSDYGNDTKQ